MAVQIAQEFRRIPVGEIIIGADKQCAGMRDLSRLGKITVFCRMHIIQQPGIIPVPCRIRRTVEYSLSERGKELIPALDSIYHWAQKPDA